MSEVQSQSTPAQTGPAPGAHQEVQKTGAHAGQHHLVAHHARRLPALWAASPFALMRQFSMDVDRLFGEVLAEGLPMPQMEVFERDGQLLVRADLPGLSKNDVTIDLADDVLTISGERHEEHEATRQGVRVSERHYGRFSRRIPLPEGVDAGKAGATFANGVLEIAMPAPAGNQHSRRIEIQDGTNAGTTVSGDRTKADA